MSSSDMEIEPAEIAAEAEGVTTNLLPQKSKALYEKAYNTFKSWCESVKVTNATENVLLAYFNRKAASQKPSTLWAHYSMLRSTLLLFEALDISKFSKLQAFLKRKSAGYKPRKSRTLTREEVDAFLENANDEFLLIKVATIFGIFGACRTDELLNLKPTDIQDLGPKLLVTVTKTKTKIDRMFTVLDSADKSYIHFYRKYAKLRPKHTPHDRFFLFYKNGRCTTQPVGKNTLSKYPSEIAKFLKLEEPERYTGHCFRRTSATLLVESGGDLMTLKRHGGWKSSAVAEGYIDDSIKTKTDTARKIMAIPDNDVQPGPTTSIEEVTFPENIVLAPSHGSSNRQPTIQISNCTNCQINIKID